MSVALLTGSPELLATNVLASIPIPNAKNYQAPYPDEVAHYEALCQLPAYEPVATLEEIRALREEDAAIATGQLLVPKLTIGNCAELIVEGIDDELVALIASGKVDIDKLRLPGIEAMADGYNAMEEVGRKALGDNASVEIRGLVQNKKPRSLFFETLKDGTQIYSYFGDGVNGLDHSQRTPNPRRLVYSRLQATLGRREMQRRGYGHTRFAHEALSLGYDGMGVHVDEATGEEYIATGHRLWVGNRTNNPEGEHVKLLSGIVNPVGVKIGPSSSADHIARIVEKLNPNLEPGKLTFMIRVGLEHGDKLRELAGAIAKYAPNQLQVDDVHAHTVQVDTPSGKVKVRSVEHSVANVKATSEALREADSRLHGLHIEAKGTNERPECVDRRGQLPDPENKPIVDPLYTLRQVEDLLEATRDELPRAA